MNAESKLTKVVRLFRSEDSQASIESVMVFLELMNKDGQTKQELVNSAGFTPVITERAVVGLSSSNTNKAEGLGWCEWRVNVDDSDNQCLYLSPKGKERAQAIRKIIEQYRATAHIIQ